MFVNPADLFRDLPRGAYTIPSDEDYRDGAYDCHVPDAPLYQGRRQAAPSSRQPFRPTPSQDDRYTRVAPAVPGSAYDHYDDMLHPEFAGYLHPSKRPMTTPHPTSIHSARPTHNIPSARFMSPKSAAMHHSWDPDAFQDDADAFLPPHYAANPVRPVHPSHGAAFHHYPQDPQEQLVSHPPLRRSPYHTLPTQRRMEQGRYPRMFQPGHRPAAYPPQAHPTHVYDSSAPGRSIYHLFPEPLPPHDTPELLPDDTAADTFNSPTTAPTPNEGTSKGRYRTIPVTTVPATSPSHFRPIHPTSSHPSTINIAKTIPMSQTPTVPPLSHPPRRAASPPVPHPATPLAVSTPYTSPFSSSMSTRSTTPSTPHPPVRPRAPLSRSQAARTIQAHWRARRVRSHLPALQALRTVHRQLLELRSRPLTPATPHPGPLDPKAALEVNELAMRAVLTLDAISTGGLPGLKAIRKRLTAAALQLSDHAQALLANGQREPAQQQGGQREPAQLEEQPTEHEQQHGMPELPQEEPLSNAQEAQHSGQAEVTAAQELAQLGLAAAQEPEPEPEQAAQPQQEAQEVRLPPTNPAQGLLKQFAAEAANTGCSEEGTGAAMCCASSPAESTSSVAAESTPEAYERAADEKDGAEAVFSPTPSASSSSNLAVEAEGLASVALGFGDGNVGERVFAHDDEADEQTVPVTSAESISGAEGAGEIEVEGALMAASSSRTRADASVRGAEAGPLVGSVQEDLERAVKVVLVVQQPQSSYSRTVECGTQTDDNGLSWQSVVRHQVAPAAVC